MDGDAGGKAEDAEHLIDAGGIGVGIIEEIEELGEGKLDAAHVLKGSEGHGQGFFAGLLNAVEVGVVVAEWGATQGGGAASSSAGHDVPTYRSQLHKYKLRTLEPKSVIHWACGFAVPAKSVIQRT